MADWWDDLTDSSQSGTATVEPSAAEPTAPASDWWNSLTDSSQQSVPAVEPPPQEAPAPPQPVAQPASQAEEASSPDESVTENLKGLKEKSAAVKALQDEAQSNTTAINANKYRLNDLKTIADLNAQQASDLAAQAQQLKESGDTEAYNAKIAQLQEAVAAAQGSAERYSKLAGGLDKYSGRINEIVSQFPDAVAAQQVHQTELDRIAQQEPWKFAGKAFRDQIPAVIPQKQLDNWRSQIDQLPDGPEKDALYAEHSKAVTDRSQVVANAREAMQAGMSPNELAGYKMAGFDLDRSQMTGGSITSSLPFRSAETAGEMLFSGLGNIATTLAAEAGDQTAAEQRKQSRDYLKGWARAQSDMDAQSTVPGAGIVRDAMGMVGEAAASTALPGGLLAYLTSKSVSDSLAKSDEDGTDGWRKYLGAGVHGTIDAASLVAGAKLGAGLARVAGMGGELSDTLVGKALSSLTDRLSVSKPITKMLEVGGEGAAQAVLGVGMTTGGYLTDVAMGRRKFDGQQLARDLLSNLPHDLAVGAFAGAVHELVGTLKKRNDVLKNPGKVRGLIDNYQETVGPSRVPVSDEATFIPGASFRATASAPTEFPSEAEIGPQRGAPKSLAAIQAESSQANQSLADNIGQPATTAKFVRGDDGVHRAQRPTKTPSNLEMQSAETEAIDKLRQQQSSGPSANDAINDAYASGKIIADTAKKHGVGIQELKDRVIAPRGAELTSPLDSNLPDRPKGSALQEQYRAKKVAGLEQAEEEGYANRKGKPTDQSAQAGEGWLDNSIARRPEWTGNDPARIADWLRGGFGDSYYWKFLKESGRSLEDYVRSKVDPPAAEASQAPDEAPPQQPASADTSPAPPALNTPEPEIGDAHNLSDEGDASFDFGANAEQEREPLLPKQEQFVKRRIQRIEESGDLSGDYLDTLKSLDQHTAHDILTAADHAAQDGGEVQLNIAGELKNLFGGDDRNVISYVNRAGKRITRKASSLGNLSLLARRIERRGGDPTELPGFDQAVQALRETVDNGEGDFPHLAAEASARGNGDIEAGLFDILQGGAKQFTEGQSSDYLKEILDQYNAVQERTKPAVEEVDRTANEGSIAPEGTAEGQPALSQSSQEGQVAPFELSREPSPNTSPITEPFSVPESQRLPASKSGRQPNLEGMPTDMESGTLAGQQGLFEKPADTQAARDAFDAQLTRVADLLKTKLFSNPFDPELAKEFGTLAYRAIKAGTLEFRDFVKQLTTKFGDAVMAKIGPHLQGWWDDAMAQHKSDLADKSPTSIKNATVDQERERHGLPPAMEPLRRTFGEVWDKVTQELDKNPRASDELINELRDKPRALTDREDALLLHRQVELQNEFDAASQQLLETDDDAVRAEARTRVAALSDSLLDIYNIGKQSGTETARGLNARKLLVNDDFSLAKMVRDKRVANDGRELTPEEHAKIAELQKKLADTQKAFDDYVNSQKDKRQAQGIDELIDDAKRNKRASKTKNIDEGAKDTAIAKIQQGIADGQPLSDYGTFVQKLARYFVGQGIAEREPLVDAVHGVLKDIIPDLDRRDTMDAISGYGDYRELPKDAISVKLRDLKGQMQQAAKLQDMLEKGQAPLKTGVERREPTDEERRLIKEVNETKKRLNLQPVDPAKQLKSALDAVKTRLKNQIADLEHQIGTGEKIVKNKSDTPRDAEATALEAKRDALKKQFDEIFGKPELTDEQRVRIAQKAVEKSIADLEERIKNGDVFTGKKVSKTPNAPELVAAKARRDALQEQLKEMRLLPEHQAKRDELALQAFKSRAANRIADYQERLAAGDFAPKKRVEVKLDTEAFKLQTDADRMRNDWRKALLRDRLAKRPAIDKVQDTWLRWRRASVLSSPVTLAKLTSAATERVLFTPLEELVGAGYSKAFPRFAEKAPREGFASIKAESQAITEGVTKGMRDGWKLLRTGQSDLDVTYGKDSGMPSYATDFFGHLHGALKTVPKRGEFARSFQKRAEAAIAAGLDVHDPIVQSKMAIDSYKDASRSIFMQDNRVVSAYKRALTAFDQPNKSTGKVPASSRAIGVVARTMLPIVKVPTNIVAETWMHATGAFTGSAKLARAYATGLEALHPDEADMVMRHLKKGSLGLALLSLGYFGAGNVGGYYQPGKRDDKDVGFGKVRIFGYDVPSYLLHNPLLECLQIGATVRRVWESKAKKSDTEPQGPFVAAGAAVFGLLEEVPFVKEQLEVAKAFDSRTRTEWAGKEAASLLVPQAASWFARKLDQNPQGETTRRKPETVLQGIEQEIPVLRKNVPEAKKKGASLKIKL